MFESYYLLHMKNINTVKCKILLTSYILNKVLKLFVNMTGGLLN